MAAFKRGNRKKSAGDRSGCKEDDQAQLPSSEPGIGAYGSHCVQWNYRGAASTTSHTDYVQLAAVGLHCRLHASRLLKIFLEPVKITYRSYIAVYYIQ